MRNATNARIGRGKVVHIYYPWGARTDCGAGGMSDVEGIETAAAVTCKTCLKALTAQIVRDHQEALDTDAALPVLSTTNTTSTKESPVRKLSAPQVKAIEYLHEFGNELNPEVRENTWASLAKSGLITRSALGNQSQVTVAGREAYEHTTGALLDGIQEMDTRPLREQYAGTQARFNQDVVDEVHGYALTLNAPAPATDVLEPVALDTRGRHGVMNYNRPVDAVQADRDLLVKTHGEHRADEILDTWYVLANRADRRREDRQDRVEGRREMRLRRRPSRRRFTSEAALIRKAERRAAKILAA